MTLIQCSDLYYFLDQYFNNNWWLIDVMLFDISKNVSIVAYIRCKQFLKNMYLCARFHHHTGQIFSIFINGAQLFMRKKNTCFSKNNHQANFFGFLLVDTMSFNLLITRMTYLGYFTGFFYKMAIECWLLRALISSKIFLNYRFEDLLIHVGLVFTQLVVMSSSWNFPARAEPSWSTSIFELKPSWQYACQKIANS